MRRCRHVRLGLGLPVLVLLALAGCENSHGNGRSSDGYYGAYGYPYGGYDGGWWGRSDDRYGDRGDRQRAARYDDGRDWKERKYERKEDNGRPGDAERFNDRLCRNGIPGDAPAGCGD